MAILGSSYVPTIPLFQGWGGPPKVYHVFVGLGFRAGVSRLWVFGTVCMVDG